MGFEIVRVAVDYHSPAHHITDPEPVRQDFHVGPPPCPQQRRQVSGVPGMGLFQGVIVPGGVQETLSAAIASLMDMKSEESHF